MRHAIKLLEQPERAVAPHVHAQCRDRDPIVQRQQDVAGLVELVGDNPFPRIGEGRRSAQFPAIDLIADLLCRMQKLGRLAQHDLGRGRPLGRPLVGEKKQVVALAPVGDLSKTAVELDGQIRPQALEFTPCAVVYIERTRVGSGGDRCRRRRAREEADFANWRSAPGRDPERGR